MQLPFIILMLAFTVGQGYDFCNSDPRLQILYNETKAPNSSCKPIIYMALLDNNPFHALHDRLWALSHYLKHCDSEEAVVEVNKRNAGNLTLCHVKDENPTSRRPNWATCVLMVLSKWHNAKIHFAGRKEWPGEPLNSPGICFSRHTWMGVHPADLNDETSSIRVAHFRGMSWFGRNCEDQYPCNGGLVPLPPSFQSSAMNSIKRAVLNYHNIHYKRHESINFLLYDRNDTNRRQWIGAENVYAKLKSDTRLNVKFLRRMPSSFQEQVELFTWANVVFAPHGAAMANTIFMESGSDIVEIARNCEDDSKKGPYAPRDWTGWHAHLLGLNLRYVHCFYQYKAERKPKELVPLELSQFTVDLPEVFLAIEAIIERQVYRRKRYLEREKELEEDARFVDIPVRMHPGDHELEEDARFVDIPVRMHRGDHELRNLTIQELFFVAIVSIILLASRICFFGKRQMRRV